MGQEAQGLSPWWQWCLDCFSKQITPLVYGAAYDSVFSGSFAVVNVYVIGLFTSSCMLMHLRLSGIVHGIVLSMYIILHVYTLVLGQSSFSSLSFPIGIVY